MDLYTPYQPEPCTREKPPDQADEPYLRECMYVAGLARKLTKVTWASTFKLQSKLRSILPNTSAPKQWSNMNFTSKMCQIRSIHTQKNMIQVICASAASVLEPTSLASEYISKCSRLLSSSGFDYSSRRQAFPRFQRKSNPALDSEGFRRALFSDPRCQRSHALST